MIKEGGGRRRKFEVLVPSLRGALYAIRTINHFYEATEGNSKKLSRIMDIKEHLKTVLGTPLKTEENHRFLCLVNE
jgi:hypothetical protein